MSRMIWCLALLSAAPVMAQFPPIPGIPPWLLGMISGNAKESTQIMNHAELVSTLATQVKQLTEQVNMYKDMVIQAKKVGNHNFSGILGDINQLSGMVQTGYGLTYALGGVEQQFMDTYQGYLPAGYASRKRWLQAALDTSRGVLRAIHAQHGQLQGVDSLLGLLRGQASSAEGRLQSLQVMGQLAHEEVAQLQRLNVLLMADISSKQAYQAAVVQQEGSAAAAEEKFFQYTPRPLKGIGYVCC